MVDHIAKVLELLYLIEIPGLDSHRQRMKVFPLLLADDARQWWIDKEEGKINTWEELVETFFCKFYLESHDDKDEMLDKGDNWGIDPLEFISRVNSSFKNHMKVDGRTQKDLDAKKLTKLVKYRSSGILWEFLILVGNKMHKAFPLPVKEFPLPEEVPTSSEESSHFQKKREATAVKIPLLLKSRRNCQSKSNDSYAKRITLNLNPNPNSLYSQSLHQEMDQQNHTLAKIPILDTGKFKQWQFRIQQYLQHEYYALWEVYEFGDSYEVPVNAATTEKRNNDVKARTTLLLSLPDKHQLRFSKYKTTQELWAAILKTFGGNEATKKTKKNLLKKQYGNFKAEGSETLEQTFNKLQVIVSQLQFMDVEIKQDDLDQNGSQIKFENINQIDEDDIEDMDIKWNIALLSMRADRFWKKTGKKISILGTDVAGFDKSKVECFNCCKMGHFARECRAPRSQDRGRRDNYRQCYKANDKENHALVADEEAPTEFSLMAKTSAESKVFDNSLCSKDWLAQVEARLTEHRDRELKYCEKIKGLEFKTESSANCIESLKKELELIKKEKEGLDSKLTGFQTSLKDLDSPLESQRLDKNKEGLGYSVVPPPSTQIYSPPKKDMSWTGLPKFKDDTLTDYSRPSPAIESTLYYAQNRNPSEASPSTISPKPFIKFVKANDSPTKSKTDKAEKDKKPPVRPPMRPMRSNMNGAWPNRTSFNKLAHSYTNRPVQRTSAVISQCRDPWVPTVNRNSPPVNRKFSTGRSQNNFDDKGYWDSGCSRHMTGNISYLSYYEPFDGGYVSFGQGGCKITGKGTIKTECIVLGLNFKLSDDDNVLLRTPRQHNMYSIDINNIVPHKDLTCLVAKASADECMLWHRRLGHLNFKTMNKLVRHNLVRGLPTKCFENDHTCTACLKGKQHKASLTDDFSRFTWTFFLKTKDETSGIFRKFITEIDNIKDLKVKIIRCDNGGEFRNKEMNDFCSQKGIKREFSNARTPQQNGVAERRNRTLIETARTMLADAKLPVTFWAKAVNTACYVQNRVLVNKSQNKTPYELFNGTKDTTSQEVKKHVSSLRCIALPNWTHDALLESSSSKPQDHCSTEVPESSGNTNPTDSTSNPPANQMETLTMESPIPTVSSPVPTACFTDSPEPSSDPQDNCSTDVPESSGNSNPTATSTNPPADQLETLTVKTSILTVSSPVPTACFTDFPEPSSDTGLISKTVANQVETPSLDHILTLINRFEDIFGVTTNSVDSDGVEADKTDQALLQFCLFSCFLSQVKPKTILDALQDPSWVEAMQEELVQFKIQNVWTLVDCPKGVRPIGTKWVLKNKKDERGIVIRNKARIVAQGHTQEERIDYDEVFAHVARIEAIRLFLAYASFMGFIVYQMDVKSAFLYGTIDEEVYVMQPPRFQDPEFPKWRKQCMDYIRLLEPGMVHCPNTC
uniref:Uncharacterized protein n=1 Tax=Tanacetum cinerariifolium TaxID=118510 RepID=A0A699H8H9_TANCI|nr:hypothetical protein [Tanacetum cinerariifolium]